MRITILTNPTEKEFVVDQLPYNWAHFIVSTDGKFSSDYDIGISFMSTHKVLVGDLLFHNWINFHPGPLPRYKGRNLCYHALVNDEVEFGASVHYMDKNFDTGDIIDVWTFPILAGDTAQTLSNRTLEVAREQFAEYLPRIAAGEQFERIPNGEGMYFKKEPIDEFIPLSAWTQNRIRAITYGDFYPKVEIGGKVYKIVRGA